MIRSTMSNGAAPRSTQVSARKPVDYAGYLEEMQRLEKAAKRMSKAKYLEARLAVVDKYFNGR